MPNALKSLSTVWLAFAHYIIDTGDQVPEDRQGRREEVARIVDELHERWYSSLVRYATRCSGRTEEAEDMVQDFLLLCRELMRGIRIDSPKAWTLVVLRRQLGRQYGIEVGVDSWDEWMIAITR